MTTPKPASDTVADQHRRLRDQLPFGDTQDFEDANRGFVAPLSGPVVDKAGRVLWDNSTYDFLQGEAPETVNPSSRPAGPGRCRAGPGHLGRRGVARRADERGHHDGARGDRRRGADGLPDGAGQRGPGRDAGLPARPPGAVHGGGRDAHPAQPADAARCGRPRPARLGRLPDRGDRPVRGRGGGRLRLAPLAGVGC